MWRVWIEWDFGQDQFVFSSEEKAEAWARSVIAAEAERSDNPEDWDFKALTEEGLIGWDELTVDP